MVKTKKSQKTTSRTRQRDITNFARKFLLALILILTIAIVVVALCSLIFNKEQQTKSEIDKLAKEYYENVFYQKMLDADNFSGDAKKSLEDYNSKGLSSINVRQLILLNDSNTANTNLILEYCDQENTFVIFYPEPPYERTSYRAEFTYSCNF